MCQRSCLTTTEKVALEGYNADGSKADGSKAECFFSRSLY